MAERIRELKGQRSQIEVRMDDLKRTDRHPVHYFTVEALEAFQDAIKAIFLGGNDRPAITGHLRLSVKRIETTLPRMEI